MYERVRESIEKIRKFADTQVGEGEREIGGVHKEIALDGEVGETIREGDGLVE